MMMMLAQEAAGGASRIIMELAESGRQGRDGRAHAGKSTLAQRLAADGGWHVVNQVCEGTKWLWHYMH